MAGDYIRAHRSGAATVDRMYRRPVKPAEIVVTCAGGRPKDLNLFQAQKALDNAKNAALPIVAAALLTDGEHRVHNVPDLADARTLARLLVHMGCQVERLSGPTRSLAIRVPSVVLPEAPYVLGEADRDAGAAVFSVSRLAAADPEQVRHRVQVEALHAAGHLLGLSHCGDARCAMFLSRDAADTDRKAARLYFLHGTQWSNVDDGTQIGEYKVNYDDGTATSIPIAMGEDVRDWWNGEQGQKPIKRGRVVVVGVLVAPRGVGLPQFN